MTFSLTKMAAAAVLAAASTGAMAVPVAIDTMFGATGSFSLNGTPGTPNPWAFSGAGMDLTAANNQAYGSSFTFFGGPVNVFSGDGTYAPYNTGTADPDAPVNGGPTINGVIDAAAGTITVDMSNWTANWNGTNFNQGAPVVTGTYNSGSNSFDIAWTSTVVGGAFNGQTGAWSLQGTVTAAPIPEASTYGMMLAGLGLVGFAVRRRKLVA